MRPPAIPVSDAVRRTALELGGDAERWLVELPALVTRVASDWNLRVERPLWHDGHASVIYEVRTSAGGPAILKFSLPHPEARHEAVALQRWDGHGAVRLFRRSDDGFVLLLEHCRPGHDLWSLSVEQQRDVAAQLLPALWVALAPRHDVPSLDDTVARWEPQMHARAEASGLPREIADRAAAWSRELRAGQPLRLLHGDFHPANVLAATRAPWLAIDAKPWVGDPAFDLAQWLCNRLDRPGPADDPVAVVREEARALSERLGLDPVRVLRWAVVKAIGWEFGPANTIALDTAAHEIGSDRGGGS